ncbi:MAG: enoyl-CoA hydratase-related protein [Gammaproteobacteria bacterium]|nr:enoyl-CoA hydratase-related protein [Gammaproteobacteria bacterium]MDE0244548.1 enoyl-CoA hydratase-related protein [Gammaproteobacteria bacterium]MDE0454856.1 enoyl-CoA hydratase-related protein [Gammaproteobacteria bacterium]
MSAVKVDMAGTVQTVRLDRPDVLNALNPEAYDQLAEAFRKAEDEAVRAVILTGTGRGFCAGHDLKDGDNEDPAAGLREVNATMRAIRDLRKPVIAAINGVAAGGGMSLALCCDVKLMARSARLVPAFLDLGLVPDMGASWMVANTLGYGRALEWLVSGEALDAETALEWGLVNVLVDDGELREAAQRKADELAAGPTLAIGLTKQLLSRALSASFEDTMEWEARFQQIVGRSADYAESLAAFRDRRKPKFQGK